MAGMERQKKRCPSAGKELNSRFSFGLIHFILVDSSAVICWTSPFVILRVSGLFVAFILFWWKILLANNVDPDQTPHFVASDLGLHCLTFDTFTGFPGKTGLISFVCRLLCLPFRFGAIRNSSVNFVNPDSLN